MTATGRLSFRMQEPARPVPRMRKKAALSGKCCAVCGRSFVVRKKRVPEDHDGHGP